jgi:dipeptidyl aminopeptidase/acylaminoacyl peptidase
MKQSIFIAFLMCVIANCRAHHQQMLTPFMQGQVIAGSFMPGDSTCTVHEIIYGRKDGMALTMLRLTPKQNPNRKAIVMIRSGGWGSNFNMASTAEAVPFIKKGFNVFIVFHGSEPVYTVVDAIEDVQRAVRYIRYHSNEMSIDAEQIGAIGRSAGGHLSLMCGLADSSFMVASKDPVDRVSSKVRAVVAVSPSSNFFDWDGNGNNAYSAFLFKEMLVHVLEFRKWDAQRRRFSYMTDTAGINDMLKKISPAYHVSGDDAATLLFHSSGDNIVPIFQSEILAKKLQEMHVPVSLQIKTNSDHGWQMTNSELQLALNWFEKYLK